MPPTAYRHMRYLNNDETVNKWAVTTLKTKTATGTYRGFETYPTATEAKKAFQIAPEWRDARLRGTFDTLQLYDNGKPQVRVPFWEGDTLPPRLEPFAEAYPQYGNGGAIQLHADNRVVQFEQVDIINE